MTQAEKVYISAMILVGPAFIKYLGWPILVLYLLLGGVFIVLPEKE